jgi:1,2-phenylacetyl-CoA epoxidase catalytic subunit
VAVHLETDGLGEAAVAQLLLDRSGRIDLMALCAAYPRYAEPLRRIMVQEEKHESMSVAMLRECMAASEGALSAAQGHVAKWLPRAIASLGESVGLMTAIEALRPTIEACGLVVPAR